MYWIYICFHVHHPTNQYYCFLTEFVFNIVLSLSLCLVLSLCLSYTHTHTRTHTHTHTHTHTSFPISLPFSISFSICFVRVSVYLSIHLSVCWPQVETKSHTPTSPSNLATTATQQHNKSLPVENWANLWWDNGNTRHPPLMVRRSEWAEQRRSGH